MTQPPPITLEGMIDHAGNQLTKMPDKSLRVLTLCCSMAQEKFCCSGEQTTGCGGFRVVITKLAKAPKPVLFVNAGRKLAS